MRRKSFRTRRIEKSLRTPASGYFENICSLTNYRPHKLTKPLLAESFHRNSHRWGLQEPKVSEISWLVSRQNIVEGTVFSRKIAKICWVVIVMLKAVLSHTIFLKL